MKALGLAQYLTKKNVLIGLALFVVDLGKDLLVEVVKLILNVS